MHCLLTRVLEGLSLPSSVSRILSSTACAIWCLIWRFIFALVEMIAASTRSLMIWSTSLPWKPTSVNFVASTCSRPQQSSGLSLCRVSASYSSEVPWHAGYASTTHHRCQPKCIFC